MTLDEFSRLVERADPWEILGLAPTNEPKAIKRAYAGRLKIVRPDDAPRLFQSLREAYEWALAVAPHVQMAPLEESPAPSIVESTIGEVSPSLASDYLSPQISESDIFAVSEPQVLAQNALPNSAFPSQVIDSFSLDISTATAPPVFSGPTFSLTMPDSDEPDFDEATQPPGFSDRDTVADFRAVASKTPRLSQASVDMLLNWLRSCPDLESLSERANVEHRLRAQMQLAAHEEFEDGETARKQSETWPAAALLAANAFFHWDDIHAKTSFSLKMALNTAQAKLALSTEKPSWQFLSRASVVCRLQQPFSLFNRLMLGLIWRSEQKSLDIFDSLERDRIAPERVFDRESVEFERKAEGNGFNKPKFLIALTRSLIWPALAMLLSLFVDSSVDLLTLIFTSLGLSAVAMTVWTIAVSNKTIACRIWRESLIPDEEDIEDDSIDISKPYSEPKAKFSPTLKKLLFANSLILVGLWPFGLPWPAFFLSLYICAMVVGYWLALFTACWSWFVGFAVVLVLEQAQIVLLTEIPPVMTLVVIIFTAASYLRRLKTGKAEGIYWPLMRPARREIANKPNATGFASVSNKAFFWWLIFIFAVQIVRHFAKP